MIQDIRKELLKYREYKERINNIDIELDLIEELIGYGVEGIDYDQVGGGSGKISDIVADITHNKDIKTRTLLAEREILKAKVESIKNCLNILEHKERECMYLYYEQGYSWNQVAEKENMTYPGVQTLRERSITKMQKFIDKNN